MTRLVAQAEPGLSQDASTEAAEPVNDSARHRSPYAAARYRLGRVRRGFRTAIRTKADFLGRAISFWRIYGLREFSREAFKFLRSHYGLTPPVKIGTVNSLLAQARVNPIATPSRSLFSRPCVVVIGELSLPQCKKYRVMQKLEILADIGIDYTYADWRDGHRCMNLLQTATCALFYRCPDSNEFKAYVRECERLGTPTIYDIDDPIFSREIYEDNVNLAHLHPAERNNLINGSTLYLDALRRCKFTSGSTPRLCAELKRVTGRDAFLWRNLVDMETLDATQFANQGQVHSDAPPTLVYASGSRAHEADFREIEAVVTTLMKRNTGLRLRVLGYLDLPPSLAPYRQRISQHPFSHYYDYMNVMGQGGICLIPLVQDVFNDCKSAIRFLEASLLHMPCVASKVGDYVNLVEHGRTGFLADRPEEWVTHIQTLIDTPQLRRDIAHAARDAVRARHTTASWKRDANPSLLDLITLADAEENTAAF